MKKMGLGLIAATMVIFASANVTAQAGNNGVGQNLAVKSLFFSLKTGNNGYSKSILKAAAPVFGERCVTQIGSCTILPQPVGSPCKCGNVNGTTLQ